MDLNSNLSRYIKFSVARKKFKNVVSQKMGNSFEDEDDSGLITKKFWSYVKATANSTRIPELVYLENTFKSNSLDQSELFNTFFYNQFSEASTYDIVIDHNNSDDFSIDFNESRVYDILSNINPNKAMGPEKYMVESLKVVHYLFLSLCHIYLQKAIMVCPYLMSGKQHQLFQFTRKDLNQMFKTIAQSH